MIQKDMSSKSTHTVISGGTGSSGGGGGGHHSTHTTVNNPNNGSSHGNSGTTSSDNNLFLDDLVQDFDISLSGFGGADTNVSLIRDLNQVISTLGDNIKVETIDEDNAQDSTDAHSAKYFTASHPESPLSNDSCGSYTSTDSERQNYGNSCANYAAQPPQPHQRHHQQHPSTQSSSAAAPVATDGSKSATTPTTPTTKDKARKATKRLCFKGVSTGGSGGEELSPISSVSSSVDASSTHNFPSDISESGETVGYSSRNMENSYGYSWRRYSKTDAPSVNNKMSSVQIGKTIKSEPHSRVFQYILGAPTASGVKLGSMTMTYLNQGQPYEIRLKKISDIPNYDGKNLRTSMRLGFVEKRLQYRETEEMINWCKMHSKDRIIDVDFALSYGVFDVQINSTAINSIDFVWNPNREASIFVKLNCISTEFTSKRHGGERGTPLRLIIDTYAAVQNTRLDSAQCLVKVFKSKGADRKHKTDRERLTKQPDSALYYQPSYDCTLFTLFSEDDVFHPTSSSPPDSDCPSTHSISSTHSSSAITASDITQNIATSSTTSYQSPQSSHPSDECLPSVSSGKTGLPSDATPTETYEWLNRNRFHRLTDVLMNFSSEDLRRLSRDDLIQICGLSDGIRLYNTIHAIQSTTRLTIFVTTDGKVHNGIYLKSLTHEELRHRLIEALGITGITVRNIYLIGPNDIRIMLTNNVVLNMKNESIYSCTIDKDQEEYDLVLQSTAGY